eukprot:CAMPEP_0182865110 /NCGR_PEP_ID=MMETSP0034_2-20130328/7520_1 /TAXON_ID=156128 /ORGANISM="Nephroselmis pyriformis, Strain CCMP717" /LENGTH=82 /DNA_ID=CAMNT_0024997397 /DNA_START=47 /DNA_END=295 /DNA_ORIENTATION=+
MTTLSEGMKTPPPPNTTASGADNDDKFPEWSIANTTPPSYLKKHDRGLYLAYLFTSFVARHTKGCFSPGKRRSGKKEGQPPA